MLNQDFIINKVYQFQKMKSVYTFLKEYKQLRESETSERAAELGYEWQRRNVYVDPKSGKRYRGTGTKFEEIPDEQPAERKPGQQAPQKTLDKFKQDAQERPAVAPQIPQPSAFPANPVDDGQEAEMRAVAASQGLWPHYTNARKEYHINRELQQIQADREAAQAELEAQQQPEPQVEEPPKKEPEEFRTIDDVVVEKEEEDIKELEKSGGVYDISDEVEDFDKELAEYEKDVLGNIEQLKEISERKAKALEKQYGAFKESLSKIPDKTAKSSFLKSVANAKTFEGRINTGAGKNNLGYADIQNLVANRDRLMTGYGDGSPEQIEKFVRSVRSNEVSDEFVDASFEILPEAFKKSLSGKGQVTNDKYVSDDKPHKDIHFLGYNEDGSVKRGAASNKDRAKLMWRIYLEQGGRDAYTGLPLDIQAMDLEHVRGFTNKDGGKPGKKEFEERENDKNFTLINSNINQKKVDLSMKDFFEREVDPHANKSEEEFGGIEKLFEKANEIGSVGDQLVKTLLGKGGKGLSDELTKDILIEHFNQDDQRYTELRNEFRKAAGDDASKKKAAGLKSKLGKQLLKASGLTRGITDPSGRRTVALQENVYRGFLQSMANAKPADRQRYMDGWAEAIKAGNEERSPKAVNRTLVELGLIDDEILNDRKAGRVFKEECEYDNVDCVRFIKKYNKNNKFF
jgi:hypothetical protein